jgi:flagellar motor switch protein FliN/FliY
MTVTPSSPKFDSPTSSSEDDSMSSPLTDSSNMNKDYAKANFQNLEGSANAGSLGNEFNLDVILDVAVTLSMEVGRAKIPIRNLLQLNQGSVVELERTAGEPLDVYANGTLIAHGEVVVVNEKFGVRLTDVVSPAERIRKLK